MWYFYYHLAAESKKPNSSPQKLIVSVKTFFPADSVQSAGQHVVSKRNLVGEVNTPKHWNRARKNTQMHESKENRSELLN